MSRASSAIEWRTHVRLINRSSTGSNLRLSRLLIDGRPVMFSSADLDDPLDRLERPVDLGRCVVVDQPKPQDATAVRLAEPLHEARRVEVAVPGVDAVSGERLGCRAGMETRERHGHGRYARVETSGVRDAVHRHTANARQALDQT